MTNCQHCRRPPGTGKTSTICGLAGEFLSRRRSAPTPLQPGKTPTAPVPAKLLICAPSNAAIDEVAKRLRDGIRDDQGRPVVPKVVRIGADASINVGVKDIALDALVEAKMNLQPGQPKSDLEEEMIHINRQLTEITTRLKQISTELATAPGGEDNLRRQELDVEKKTLDSKRRNLNAQRNQARDKQTDSNRALDAAKRKFRQEVLREADILCSTLSGSGHDTLEEFDFETVIIDEAAQSVELSSLIPLKYRCKRCILVGGMSIFSLDSGKSFSQGLQTLNNLPRRFFLLERRTSYMSKVCLLASRNTAQTLFTS